VTIFVLGLCVLMLALGGISLDLWRGFSDRRALAATADAAALAGAGALDEDAYRSQGVVRLIPAEAEARARAVIADQADPGPIAAVRVSADEHAVTVELQGHVPLTLLRLFVSGDLALDVHAIAEPRPDP